MQNRIVEWLEVSPFEEMEEIENGLYRMDIIGLREDKVGINEVEIDRDNFIFGDIEGILPAIICHDGDRKSK